MDHQQRNSSHYIGKSVPISGEMGKILEMYPESYKSRWR